MIIRTPALVAWLKHEEPAVVNFLAVRTSSVLDFCVFFSIFQLNGCTKVSLLLIIIILFL